MSVPTRGTTVFCLANRWNDAFWYAAAPGVANLWLASAGSAVVRWQMFSDGPPFYWAGSFTNRACIRIGPGFWTLLQFNPSASVTMTVLGSC